MNCKGMPMWHFCWYADTLILIIADMPIFSYERIPPNDYIQISAISALKYLLIADMPIFHYQTVANSILYPFSNETKLDLDRLGLTICTSLWIHESILTALEHAVISRNKAPLGRLETVFITFEKRTSCKSFTIMKMPKWHWLVGPAFMTIFQNISI